MTVINLNGLDIVLVQNNKIMAVSIFDNIASGSLCTL
jgi:hypothetical protein